MAEISVGDLVSRLRLDATDFTRGLQTALQSLAQFQQTLAGMQAPLGHVQQGLQRMPQQATPAFQQLNQTITQTVTVFNTLTTNITQARTQAEGFGQSWRAIFQIAGGIGLATSITGIVSALKEFAVGTIEVGARMESLRNSFAALSGSQIQGRQEFDQLFQTAQRLGIAFEPLARGFRQLTAAATQAGVPLQDQMRLMTALAGEARRVGISNEELGRSVTAVAQIFSKGKVSMEELRQQLGEALPTAIAAFARGMGRSVEEVEKLVEAGVSATRAGAALTRGFEAMQREGGNVAEGLQQAFNRFGNEVLRSKDLLTSMVGPLSQVIGLGATYLKQVNDMVAARRLLRDTLAQEATLGAGLKESDLGRLPAEQQRRLKEVQDEIAKQGEENLLLPKWADRFQRDIREANLPRLKEEQAAILAHAVALKEQRREQEQATAAANKATDQRKLQAETIADLTKQMDALRKAQEDYRRSAAIAPELRGRLGGTLEEQARFQQGLQAATRPELEKLTKTVAGLPSDMTLPADIQAQVRAFDTGYGQIGKAIDAIKEKQQAATRAAREDEQARKQALREEAQAAEQEVQQLRQLEQQRQSDIEQIRQIVAGYTTLKVVRDAEKVATLAQGLGTSQYAKEAEAALKIVKASADAEAKLPTLRAQAAASAPAGIAAMQQTRAGESFDQRLQAAIEQQQAARAQRPEVRLRAQATREGVTLTPEREGQLGRLTALREEQERLNEATRIYEEMAGRIGDAFTGALSSIADHTKTVSAAFRDMARSILQSLGQMLVQKGVQALLNIGLGVLTSSTPVGGGGGSGAGGSGAGGSLFPGASSNIMNAQGGAIVNRPTHILAGENPAMNPEYVLNRPQMQALMHQAVRAAPTAGGQAPGISILNFPDRASAEQEAANQRALGQEVVMNVVMSDLSQGSGSKIHRAISTLSR